MKVQELIDKKKVNKVAPVKDVIETKKYLPFTEKQKLVNKILAECKVENNGYVQFNEVDKYIVFTMEIIKAYTNLEFDEKRNVAISEYDALCEADLLNDIIGTFEGEYNTVLNIMNMSQDYILQQNSVECQVAQFLHGINDKLSVALDSISSQFGAYKDLNITAEDINNLTDFISMLGK